MTADKARAEHLAVLSGLPNELWTVGDLAAYLRVPRKFVYRLNSEDRIEYVRIGREVRYSPDQVRAFIANEASELLSDVASLVRPQLQVVAEPPKGESGGRRRRHMPQGL